MVIIKDTLHWLPLVQDLWTVKNGGKSNNSYRWKTCRRHGHVNCQHRFFFPNSAARLITPYYWWQSSLMLMWGKGSSKKTRLTYNCAHLRSTKETLTIEYFRITLEKKIGWNFFGVKIFGVKIFWAKICLGEIFGWKFFGWKLFLVKIFGVKLFLSNIFFWWEFFWAKIFWG